MPSLKPRVALTLSPQTRAAFEELAEAIDKPLATAIVDMLDEIVPQIQGVSKMLRAAKAGNKEAAKRALQHLMGDSMAEAMAAAQPELFGKSKGRKK